MNRRMMAFFGSALVSGLVLLGYYTWERGALPGMHPTPHDVEFSALSLDQRGVRVRGTAHYPLQIQLKGGLGGDEVAYAFPLFAPGDTSGREIRVMVLSRLQPDPLLGFEEKTFEGLIRAEGSALPQGARDHLSMLGYRFADEILVIEDFAEPPAGP